MNEYPWNTGKTLQGTPEQKHLDIPMRKCTELIRKRKFERFSMKKTIDFNMYNL